MAVKFSVTIDTASQEFQDNPDLATAQALEKIAVRVKHTVTGEHIVKDGNGNTVGSWSFEFTDEPDPNEG